MKLREPRQTRLLLLIALLAFAVACSNTKYLKKGEQLYVGADVNIDSKGKVPEKDKLKETLKGMIQPKPNKKVLGLRPQLWFYNIAGTPKKKKGLRSFIKNNLGTPPVLFQDVNPDANADLLSNYLTNHGYFQPTVGYEIVPKGDKKVMLKFNIQVNSPYRYNDINFPSADSGKIDAEILASQKESLLKKGDVYSLDDLKAERTRIETYLKSLGYFYFSGDNLIFKVDSTIGNRGVNVYLRLKPNLPPQATKKYYMRQIYVYTGYSLDQDTNKLKHSDTLKKRGYVFIGKNHVLRPKIIAKSVFLKPHKLYNYTDYELTLNHLMGLGVYKFVNFRFTDAPDSAKGIGLLDGQIYLTPMPRRSVRAELNAVSESNNFAGPQLTLSFRNRNLFHGAELLTTTLHGSFETLISSKFSGLNTYDVGADVSLDVPRFLVPFKVGKPSSMYVPKTRFSVGYDLTNRVEYFMLNDFKAKYGYVWREDIKRQHELYPVSIDYYQLTHLTEKFQGMLAEDQFLKRSFTNQFILGSQYTYTYNGMAVKPKALENQWYFQGTAGLSGNLAYLTQRFLFGKKPIQDTPFTIVGSPYAQYARLSTDVRYYINFTSDKILIFRLAPGLGVPYGNSSTLPYAKLFFVGGNNSVRAFQPRSLGPGSFDTRTLKNQAFYLGEGGDMQLLGNIEYRYNYTGIFNGAVFMDAGNTWLVRKQPDRPGGLFKVNDFYQQIAMGVGTGLRIDVSFFVLRLDLAYPIRKPYLAEGQRWIASTKQDWGFSDLVLNLAVGYPF
jgi:outer membrane protein assembly factor BamA